MNALQNDHVGGEQVGSGTGLYWRPAMHDAAIEHAIDNGEAAPGDFRLFCGYTGWGPDQLEGEIEQNVSTASLTNGCNIATALHLDEFP